MKTHALIRLPFSWEGKEQDFGHILRTLKGAEHNIDATLENAPQVVSCTTAVRYIIRQVLGEDIQSLARVSLGGKLNLPSRMARELPIRIVAAEDARLGDIVPYWGKWFRDPSQTGVNHIGIMIDTRQLYHSTLSGGGYTLSSLEKRVEEGKIATIEQLRQCL